jgi:RNA polymerase sigma-70 factor (ECF subfamily)
MTQKDSEKLRLIYELYEQPMYRIAFAVLHSAPLAEDAVSDAFVTVIRHLGKFREPDSAKSRAYIIRIIRSSAINIYRKNKRQVEREVSIDDDVLQYRDPHQDVEVYVLGKQGDADVKDMLGKLKDADRDLVLLRCRDELSWKEVSEKMSITENNARKRFERIRKKLISMKGEIPDEK